MFPHGKHRIHLGRFGNQGNRASALGAEHLAFEGDRSAIGPQEAAEAQERRRLAGAVGPEYTEHFAAIEREGEPVEHEVTIELLAEALDA